jgi:hypothetical protein
MSCSPRGPGSLAPVIPEKLASQELDASVGASGPHAFAVRAPPFEKATRRFWYQPAEALTKVESVSFVF